MSSIVATFATITQFITMAIVKLHTEIKVYLNHSLKQIEANEACYNKLTLSKNVKNTFLYN